MVAECITKKIKHSSSLSRRVAMPGDGTARVLPQLGTQAADVACWEACFGTRHCGGGSIVASSIVGTGAETRGAGRGLAPLMLP